MMARGAYDSDSQIPNNTVVYGSQGRWLAGNGDFIRDAKPRDNFPLPGHANVTTFAPCTLTWTNSNAAATYRFPSWWDGTEAYITFSGHIQTLTDVGSDITLDVDITAYDLDDDTSETYNETISQADLAAAVAGGTVVDNDVVEVTLTLGSTVLPAQGQDPPHRAIFEVVLTPANVGLTDVLSFYSASLWVWTSPVSRSG